MSAFQNADDRIGLPLQPEKIIFSSKVLPITFFPQQIQTDKIHHRKIQKISDLEVHLVIL